MTHMKENRHPNDCTRLNQATKNIRETVHNYCVSFNKKHLSDIHPSDSTDKPQNVFSKRTIIVFPLSMLI